MNKIMNSSPGYYYNDYFISAKLRPSEGEVSHRSCLGNMWLCIRINECLVFSWLFEKKKQSSNT